MRPTLFRPAALAGYAGLPVLALVLVLVLVPDTAGAQSYGVYGNINATATLQLPGQPSQDSYLVDNFGFTDKPQALLPNTLGQVATVSNGGTATALFKGSIGSLKAYSFAAFPRGYDDQGRNLFTGYANGSAQGSFADVVRVAGAGLALGTPVSYRVDFSIDGTRSSPIFEIGGFLSTAAVANVRLGDQQSGQQVTFNWDADRNAPGLYSLTLATQVGHTLQLVGSLATSAGVTWYAQTGRSAEADFYHSALYTLSPSVAGLNTVGASGHDFMTAVPEPSTWALLTLGLAALHLRRRHGSFARTLSRP